MLRIYFLHIFYSIYILTAFIFDVQACCATCWPFKLEDNATTAYVSHDGLETRSMN